MNEIDVYEITDTLAEAILAEGPIVVPPSGTVLPVLTPEEIQRIVDGAIGLIKALLPDKVIIIQSTLDPGGLGD